MNKVVGLFKDLGLKVTKVQEISPFVLSVYFIDGHNEFFTKYFFVGPKNNVVSKHNGKFVLSIEPVVEGYNTGKLVEKDTFFLFKPLPTEIEVDGGIYKIQYKKDVWGW